MALGKFFRDKCELIDVGYFEAERLVDRSNRNYSEEGGVEPNRHFKRDAKWLIFSGAIRRAGGAISRLPTPWRSPNRDELPAHPTRASAHDLGLREQAPWCPTLVEISDEGRARLEARLIGAPMPGE